jgi:hypothetical protein
VGESASEIKNDPLAMEGLETLFEGFEPGSAMRNQDEEPSSEPVNTVSIEVVSTEEAANRLGISSRAVIKRLKSGALQGYRDESKQRAEWKIYWKEPTPEAKGTNGTNNGTGSSNRTEHQEPNGTGSSSYLVDLNKQLLDQLQVLTYKNGFLESQLLERQRDIERRDAELRLLMDSQHNKQGWWTRFCSWFIVPAS